MLLTTYLVAVLLFVYRAMPLDPYLSNGTCYYDSGKEADPKYIPTGNVAFGHIYCCQGGDKFNHNVSACVAVVPGASQPYTYLAGCTDYTYEDPSCPYKGNRTGYEWVGLTYCTDAGFWVGCDNNGSATVTASNISEGCTCDLTGDQPDEVLLNVNQHLEAAGYLPNATGTTIAFLGGEFPVYTSLPATPVQVGPASSSSTASTRSTISTGTSSPASTVASSSSQSTPTSTPTDFSSTATPPEKHGITSGAKAGIAVGILGFAAIILALLYLLWRRKRAKQNSETASPAEFEKPPINMEPTLPDMMVTNNVEEVPIGFVDKAELPGSPTRPEIYEVDDTPSQSYTVDHSRSPSDYCEPDHVNRVYQRPQYAPQHSVEIRPELPNEQRSETFGHGEEYATGTMSPQWPLYHVQEPRHGAHELPTQQYS